MQKIGYLSLGLSSVTDAGLPIFTHTETLLNALEKLGYTPLESMQTTLIATSETLLC